MDIPAENCSPVKGVKQSVKERAMKRCFSICALMLFFLVSGCATVTEDDLAALQGINAVARREAIIRISQGPGFPLNFMPFLLNRNNEAEAVNMMVNLLHGDERETVDTQVSILKALARLGKKTKVPASVLIEKLRDEDPVVCREAVAALAQTKSREGLPALLELMDEERNKYAVIWALGEIGDPSAIPVLSRLLVNGDEYEKYNARKALEKIEEAGKKNSGSSIAMADGSAVRGTPPPPSPQEPERIQVARASDGRVSREIPEKRPDSANSRSQDGKIKQQTAARQTEIQRAGKKNERSQQPLALQRKQLLQALGDKRGQPAVAKNDAKADPTQVLALTSQDAGAPERTSEGDLPTGKKEVKVREAGQIESMPGGRPDNSPESKALLMAQGAFDTQRFDAEEKSRHQACSSPQEGKEERGKAKPVPVRQEVAERASALYLEALAYHRKGSLQEAKKLYEDALEISPNLAPVWNNMGAIYMKERNYSAAVTVFRKALSIEPKGVDPYYNLACLYALQENVAQSLSYLKKAVSVDDEARKWAKTDTDLKNLHGHAEYEKIIRETRSS